MSSFGKIKAISIFPILILCSCALLKGPGKILVKSRSWVITVDEFKDRLEAEISLIRGKDTEYLKERRREILEELIEEKILLDESEKLGITAEEKEVEEFIKQVKEQYGEEFERHHPPSSDRFMKLRQWIRKRTIMKKTIDELTKQIVPTENEMAEYYERNINEFIRPERVKLWQIVVMDRDKARGIWELLKKGEDFSNLARLYSVGPEGKKGGFMGFFKRGELPKELDEVAFRMPPGKVSDVIRSPYGFHIIYVEKREAKGAIPFGEAKDTIRRRLTDEKREVFLTNWIRGKKDELQIKIVEEEWEKLLEDS